MLLHCERLTLILTRHSQFPLSSHVLLRGLCLGKSQKTYKPRTQHNRPTNKKEPPIPHSRSTRYSGRCGVDIVGPVSPPSLNGALHAVVAVCYTTGYLIAYPIRFKSQAHLCLRFIVEKLAKPHGHRVQVVKSDNAKNSRPVNSNPIATRTKSCKNSQLQESALNPRSERAIALSPPRFDVRWQTTGLLMPSGHVQLHTVHLCTT